MTLILKIGTRGSPLALKQTGMVTALLRKHAPEIDVRIIEIKTSGDWKPEHGETRLSETKGGKGQFVKEIEKALLSGDIDCAVHSIKDVPSILPEGLAIDHVIERTDPRDTLISNICTSVAELPKNAVIGTASLRRQSLILAQRPDLRVVPLRGNVHTRIEKMLSGQVDAIILAMAGLTRLGITDDKDLGKLVHPIETDNMLPACGQGIIGIETRTDDKKTRTLLDKIHCKETGICLAAERQALLVMDGSCHTPIGVHATLRDNKIINIKAFVASEDGTQIFREEITSEHGGYNKSAQKAGNEIGTRLKNIAPAELFT